MIEGKKWLHGKQSDRSLQKTWATVTEGFRGSWQNVREEQGVDEWMDPFDFMMTSV